MIQVLFCCQVIDIFLKGVLLQLLVGVVFVVGMFCLVKLLLGEVGVGDIVIVMVGELVYVEGDYVGVLCCSIDFEFIIYLCCLIEVNFGDLVVFECEFKVLIVVVSF